MSSGYWQTEKQREQYSSGKEATQKVSDYIKVWKTRCYSDDIPQEVLALLQKTNRVPSYKAIAIAILKNDLTFGSLGFSRKETDTSKSLINELKEKKSTQMRLI